MGAGVGRTGGLALSHWGEFQCRITSKSLTNKEDVRYRLMPPISPQNVVRLSCFRSVQLLVHAPNTLAEVVKGLSKVLQQCLDRDHEFQFQGQLRESPKA